MTEPSERCQAFCAAPACFLCIRRTQSWECGTPQNRVLRFRKCHPPVSVTRLTVVCWHNPTLVALIRAKPAQPNLTRCASSPPDPARLHPTRLDSTRPNVPEPHFSRVKQTRYEMMWPKSAQIFNAADPGPASSQTSPPELRSAWRLSGLNLLDFLKSHRREQNK